MLSPSRGLFFAKSPRAASLALRFLIVLLPLVVLLSSRDAHAYTWMIKRNYPSCTVCHADPSGGELLTGYGRLITELSLSTNWSGEEASGSVGSRSRLALRAPESFAAGAKAAEKKGKPEAITLEEDPPAADAKATEAEGAEAEAEEGEAKPEDAEEQAPAAAESATAKEPVPFSSFMFGLFEMPDWLLLGGSYRHLNIISPSADKKFRTFPMMMDLYGQLQFGIFKAGGSIGGARVAAGSPYARPAQVTANQGDQWNLISRTHYIGVDVLPELTLRAGRLNLPFGVRIPEHTMWVRQQTRTDRESGQQHGLAGAYVGESFRGELMAIAGNYQINPDAYRERGYSGYFEYFAGATTAIGISSLVTAAKNDRLLVDGKPMTRQVHGGMLRAGFTEEIALLAEANAIVRSRHELGYVGFAQLDYEPVQGLHLMLTGEALDEGYSQAADAAARGPGAGKPKFGGWLSASWFFLTHFDVRVDGIQRQGEDLSILAQLHVYL